MITCAQLCGSGHASMKGGFTVDSPEGFQKWLQDLKAREASGGGGAQDFQ